VFFERDMVLTHAAAGIEQLVTQFAAGDRYARRDLIALAEKLGFDLTAGQHGAIEKEVPPWLRRTKPSSPTSSVDRIPFGISTARRD
jgi:hypothetical protein